MHVEMVLFPCGMPSDEGRLDPVQPGRPARSMTQGGEAPADRSKQNPTVRPDQAADALTFFVCAEPRRIPVGPVVAPEADRIAGDSGCVLWERQLSWERL